VKEYRLTLDLIKMSALGITPQFVAAALGQTDFITANGYVTDHNRMYLNVTDASIHNLDELENTVLKTSLKRVVLVKDIATAEIAERKDYVKIDANGKNVPLIAVLKQPTVNLMSVSAEVNSRVEELNKLLPKGVHLRPYYDQAEFVNDSIGSLRDVLWVGLLLAVLVTILFLRSWKASAVVLLTIPVTLSLSLVVLYLAGYTFNIMTIGAIATAIALIIDDAIVVVEQIHRTHEEHPEESSFKLVTEAIKYLFPAMLGSSLSTIVIFIPFIIMSGVAGAYFKVMTNTMIIVLSCSFFVTWICLPVLYVLFSKEKHTVIEKTKQVKHRGFIAYFITRPVYAVAFLLVLAGIVIYLFPKLPSGFLPEMDEGSIVLDYKSPPGTSLEETERMLHKVETILAETPEVEAFSRRLGTQMGFFITEPNYGDFLIHLKKKRDKTTDEVSDDIRQQIEKTLPALRVDFGQVIGDMLGDLMTTAQPVEVKIFGDDQEVLKRLARKTAEIVEKVPGTADVFDGITIAGPEIFVEPKSDKLALYNLDPTALQFEIQNKVEGNVVGGILERDRVADIRTVEGNNRNPSFEELKNSQIMLPNGKLKPVSEFAELKLHPGVAEIDRENLKPMIAVVARLNGRDLGSVLHDIQKEIKSKVALPAGYTIEYGGAYKEQQTVFQDLLIILVTASFLVFIVILFLFQRIKTALVIMLLSLLGIAGSILALIITGTPLNVGSYTGIIMIISLIGENSIFTYLQYREARNKGSVEQALVYAISTRLRPKLMTALGAICALFPLALGIGTGAQMHQPLAIAIIGGLIIALPLLLIVLPTLLRLIED
jgi:multidrug efflux pump subunit AcrB